MKNYRKYAVASILALSVAGIATADNRSEPSSGTGSNTPTQQPAQGAGGMQGDQRGMQGQQNAQAEQTQMIELYRKIAQDPTMAGDKLFVVEAAAMDQWEIAFSRLVEQRGQDQQVKELARMVGKDHEQSAQQLQQFAQTVDLQLPQGLPAAKQAKLQVLSTLPPEELEKAYVSSQKAGHLAAISTYRDHAKMAKNDQLKQWITQATPKLEQHGQMIMQVAQAKNIGDNTQATAGTGNQPRSTPGGNTPGNSGTGTAGAGDDR
jgi:predicted outer membrane protein